MIDGKTVAQADNSRDGSIDVTGKGLIAEKVPYFRAFLASDRRRQRAKFVAKNAPTEHIKGNVRKVE